MIKSAQSPRLAIRSAGRHQREGNRICSAARDAESDVETAACGRSSKRKPNANSLKRFFGYPYLTMKRDRS